MMSSTQAWMQKVGPWRYCWRMGSRQFVKRVLKRDLTLRLANGREVFLPRTSQFSSVAWVTGGEVDDGFEQLLRWFARPGTAFFDVGAHFGFYSVFLADLHPLAVAFEPDPRTLPALQRNLAAVDRGVCIAAAVSNQVGKMRFVTAAASPQSHLEVKGEAHAWKDAVEVDVTTLDATWRKLGQPQVGTMKIDTEGHESAVLWGGHEMIRHCQPQMLVEATAESLLPHCDWLGQLGYTAVLLGERRYGRRQAVQTITMDRIQGHFTEGMILLLPLGAKKSPGWSRLEQRELAFG